MRDPDLDLVVALAVADTYLASTEVWNTFNPIDLRVGVGRALNLLRESGPSDIHLNPGDRTEAESLIREANIASIREFLDTFPFTIMRDGPITNSLSDNDDDFFPEGLLNNVRNQVISHQSFMLKIAKSKRRNLLDRIKRLQSDLILNFDELNDLEIFLNRSLDLELRHELGKMSGFEAVNSEKIPPFFLGLAKSSKSEAKMEDIKNYDGVAFTNSNDMKTYVKNFYSDLYKRDANDPADFSNCIENFLGDDICRNPIAINSKIPADLAARLDTPITIAELDASVLQANKSAWVGWMVLATVLYKNIGSFSGPPCIGT